MTNTSILDQIDNYIFENTNSFINDLAKLCGQPSVSATGTGIQDCAQLVKDMLQEKGYRSEILATQGNPVVYGEQNGRSEKTMLFYLHYDVQPPDPIEAWDSPPFELTRRGDKLFARGVVDDKGHIVTRLAALAAIRNTMGELPCNVKFIIEGEEELGSPNILPFIEKNLERLAADGCIWEFGGVDYNDSPSLALGMRGICYIELVSKTASIDAHSGLGGSIFPNAAWRLVWALQSIKDSNEKINVAGFYDNVRQPSESDIELLSKLPDNAQQLRNMYGIDHFLLGLRGGSELKKAAVFEPSCTICGIGSGYQGPGSKTIIPAEARAKVDFRLVPDQSPEEILEKLRTHLDSYGFEDIEIQYNGGTIPARTDPDHPLVQLTVDTAKKVYGRDTVLSPIIGGSGPNYPFIHLLNLPVVSAGVGYPGNNIHAPNEHMRVHDFIQGIRHTAYIVEAFARTF